MHSSRNIAQHIHNSGVLWTPLRSATLCRRRGFLRFSCKKLPNKWKWVKSVGFFPPIYQCWFYSLHRQLICSLLAWREFKSKRRIELLEKGAPVSKEQSTVIQEKKLWKFVKCRSVIYTCPGYSIYEYLCRKFLQLFPVVSCKYGYCLWLTTSHCLCHGLNPCMKHAPHLLERCVQTQTHGICFLLMLIFNLVVPH